jgi:non-heme chloroperoxidase
LATNLPPFPRRLQLPIPLGLNLPLISGEHVLRRDAIHAGRRKYTHIPVPILAIYALPPNFEDLPGGDPVERAAFEARTAVTTEAQAKAFEAGVPSARVVRLPRARHEVFSSNEEDVFREMNAFIGSLQ